MRVAVAVLMMTGAAGATEIDLSDRIAGCWNPPPLAGTESVNVVFDVRFDGRGLVDDLSLVDGDTDRASIEAAAMAVQRCAPYDLEGQTVRIRFSFPGDGAIDPFTPLD